LGEESSHIEAVDNEVECTHEQERLVRFFSAVVADVGRPISGGATVLDFGCGEGDAVAAWRAAGYDASGCDVVIERPDEGLRLIEKPYRLPFADATFDLVVSNMVLEHVQDHDAAFKEIRRVLKPGAVSLHLFPPRWTPIEPHVFVPFATVLQEQWWLALWARVGIRNEFQAGVGWREVTALNLEYLRTRTNYLTRSEVLSIGRRWFDEATFVEALALKHGRRTRAAYPLTRRLPPLARLYGALRTCLLLLGRANAAPLAP
jgi:SAM-dependent methyltransferase